MESPAFAVQERADPGGAGICCHLAGGAWGREHRRSEGLVIPEAEVGSADQIFLGPDGIVMKKVVEIFIG